MRASYVTAVLLLMLIVPPTPLHGGDPSSNPMGPRHGFAVGMTSSVHGQINREAANRSDILEWEWTGGNDQWGNTDLVFRRILGKADLADMPAFWGGAGVAGHFDNITFEPGGYPERYDVVAFLNRQWADLEVALMELALEPTSEEVRRWYTEDTVRAMGFILHAVQDLYAHSNYVEWRLEAEPGLAVEEIGFLIELGPDPSVEQPFSYVYREGMYTGTYGFPPRLGIPHHDEMNKDAPNVGRGSLVRGTRSNTLFEYAFEAAVQHTILVFEAFDTAVTTHGRMCIHPILQSSLSALPERQLENTQAEPLVSPAEPRSTPSGAPSTSSPRPSTETSRSVSDMPDTALSSSDSSSTVKLWFWISLGLIGALRLWVISRPSVPRDFGSRIEW